MGNKSSGQVREDSDEEEEYHYHEEILSQSRQEEQSEPVIYRPYKLQTSFTGSEPENDHVNSTEPSVSPAEEQASTAANQRGDPADEYQVPTADSSLTPSARGGDQSPSGATPASGGVSNSSPAPRRSPSPTEAVGTSHDLLEKSSESGSLSVSFSSSKLDSSMSLSHRSSQSPSSPSSGSVTTSSHQASPLSGSTGTGTSSQPQGSARDSPVSEEGYSSAQEDVQREEHHRTTGAHGKLGVNCFRMEDDESNNVPELEGGSRAQGVSKPKNVFTPLNPAPVSQLPSSPSKAETAPGYTAPVVLPPLRRSAFMPVRGNAGSSGVQSVAPSSAAVPASAASMSNRESASSVPHPGLSQSPGHQFRETPTTSPSKRKVDEVLSDLEPGVRRTGGLHRPFSANGTGESNSEAAFLSSGVGSPDSKRLRGNQDRRPEDEDRMEATSSPFAGVTLVPTQQTLPSQSSAGGASVSGTGVGSSSSSLGKRKLAENSGENPSSIEGMEIGEEAGSPRHSPHHPTSAQNQPARAGVAVFPPGSVLFPQPSTSAWPGHAEMEPQPSTSSGFTGAPRSPHGGVYPPGSSTHYPGSAVASSTASQTLPASNARPGHPGSSTNAWAAAQSGVSSSSEPVPSTSSGSRGSSTASGKRPASALRMRPQTPGEEFAHGLMNQGYFRFTLADCLSMAVRTGDITAQTSQALVNPTDSNLSHTGRLSSAIAAAAGLPMMHECQEHLQSRGGPLGPSEVVATCAGGSLDANVNYILHVVEPEWDGGQDDSDSLSLLISTYLGVLAHAEELQVASVAFPLIGAASFPVDIAIRAVFDAVLIFLSGQLPRSRLRSLCLVITDPSMGDFIVSFLTPLLEEVLLKGIDTMVAEALYSYNSSQRLEIQQNEMNAVLAEEQRQGQTSMAAAMEGRLFRGPPVKRPRL